VLRCLIVQLLNLGASEPPLECQSPQMNVLYFQDIVRVIYRGPHGIGYEAKGGGPCP
jgi:hypothetical protein